MVVGGGGVLGGWIVRPASSLHSNRPRPVPIYRHTRYFTHRHGLPAAAAAAEEEGSSVPTLWWARRPTLRLLREGQGGRTNGAAKGRSRRRRRIGSSDTSCCCCCILLLAPSAAAAPPPFPCPCLAIVSVVLTHTRHTSLRVVVAACWEIDGIRSIWGSDLRMKSRFDRITGTFEESRSIDAQTTKGGEQHHSDPVIHHALCAPSSTDSLLASSSLSSATEACCCCCCQGLLCMSPTYDAH